MDKLDLATFANISNAINSTLDLKSLLSLIMNTAKELTNSEGSSLMLMDNKDNNLRFYVAVGEKSAALSQIKVPLGEGVAGKCAEDRIPVIVNERDRADKIYKKVDEEIKFETRNLICVPMINDNRVIGVIEAVNSLNKKDFEQNDMELLKYLANQAAIAINNRQLFNKVAKAYKQLRHRANELSALYDLHQKTNYLLSSETLFEKALSSIVSIFNCKRCTIMLLSNDNKSLIIQANEGISDLDRGFSIPLDRVCISTYVFKSNKALLVTNIHENSNVKNFASDKYKNPSFLSVPIITDNKTIGIIHVSEKRDNSVFTNNDLQLLSSVSSHIGQAYKSIKLQAEIIEGEKIKRDIEIASKIQKRILPKVFTDNEYIKIYGMSKPAQEVGGDFYDIFMLDDDRYGLVIGDVSGKGIPAAIFMALTRNTLRAEARHHINPGELFASANIQLFEDSEQGMFTTCAYFLVQPKKRVVYWSNAGHNHQMIYRNKTNKLEILKSNGLPLGVFEEKTFSDSVFEYEAGDRLILYTDGVTEAFNSEDEEFGEDRLYSTLLENMHLEPKELIQTIHQTVSKFTENCDQFDDFTIMVATLK